MATGTDGTGTIDTASASSRFDNTCICSNVHINTFMQPNAKMHLEDCRIRIIVFVHLLAISILGVSYFLHVNVGKLMCAYYLL